MNFLKQILIIISITFLGEILNHFIPLPIPAGIYGLIIMFILLQTKIIKIENVKEVSSFFLGIMPLFFVPSSVAFMNAFPILKKHGIQFLIIGIGTTLLVMIATGHMTQLVIKISKKHKQKKLENNNDSNQ